MTAHRLGADVPVSAGADTVTQVSAANALADELLRQMRQDDLAPDSTASLLPRLPQEVEDALYAWGVSCHEAGRHADASALFGALCRRQPPSLRLLKATGASHLARGDYERSAKAYAQAHALATADAEVLFFWAQAEALRGQPAAAVSLVRQAAGLAQAFEHKWPGLQVWCEELLAQLETSTSIAP